MRTTSDPDTIDPDVPASPGRTNERWCLTLFVLSGLLCALSWVAGAALLWRSAVWTRRQKLLGTIGTLPLSVAVPIFLMADAGRTTVGATATEAAPRSPLTILLALVAVLIVPLTTITWLGAAARRSAD